MADNLPYPGYVSDTAAILVNNNAGQVEGSTDSDSNDDGEDPTGRAKFSGKTPETAEMFVPHPPARIHRRVIAGWNEPKIFGFQTTPGEHTLDVNSYPQMRER